MACGLISYSGLITKSKAMKANLMTVDDYNKLVAMDSVVDFLNYLKGKPAYSKLFESIDTMNLHRGQIEQELTFSLYMDYTKIYRFAKMKQRESIQILFFRYEVRFIKSCLQRILHEDPAVDLSHFKSFFEKHSELPIEELSHCESIEDMLKKLEGTPYEQILEQVHQTHEPSLFDYETQLDIYYFVHLWKIKDKVFGKKEGKEYTEILGRQIDMLNIQWIFRFKSFYNSDKGKIMDSIIPIQYKLKKNEINNMIEAGSLEELYKIVDGTYYRRVYSAEQMGKGDLEKIYFQYVYNTFVKYKRENEMSIIPIQFFLYLKEKEIDMLTTAIECIRYKLPVSESLDILDLK